MNLTRKKRNRLKTLPLILIMALLLLFTGCQKKTAEPQEPQQQGQVTAATTDQSSTTATEQSSEATSLISLPLAEPDNSDTGSQDTSQDASAAADSIELLPETIEQQPSQLIPEDGTYTTKEDVALYIHTYGKLPQNFITKKAAKKLGWQGGSLEEYAPGKCIGGDYFGNYEGLLPKDKEYHECDIGTLGKSKRGAKRIIYSDDGYIYYTGDHYESFELLYEP